MPVARVRRTAEAERKFESRARFEPLPQLFWGTDGAALRVRHTVALAALVSRTRRRDGCRNARARLSWQAA